MKVSNGKLVVAEDQVFMENEAWRDETVMNETGKIYTGNWQQIGYKPWNFAQVHK